MSAYIVDRQTLDEIVGALCAFGLATVDTADHVGQILADANAAGYAWRYPGDGDVAGTYIYRPVGATIGQRARSLTNLMYQSCDHPGWPASEAREICARLAIAMLQEIPGYMEADAR